MCGNAHVHYYVFGYSFEARLTSKPTGTIRMKYSHSRDLEYLLIHRLPHPLNRHNASGHNEFLRCKVSGQAVDFAAARPNPTDQHSVSLTWFFFAALLVHEPSSVHSMSNKRSSFDRVAILINQGALYLFGLHASGKHGMSRGPRGIHGKF